MVFYIICSTAFSYGPLRLLNSVSLYLFFAISVFCILDGRTIRINFVAVSLILYGAIMVIGMLYTPTIESQVTTVMYYYLTMAVLALCVIQYIKEVKDIETIMFAYMLAGLAMAIYVYALYGSSLLTILQENAEAEAKHVDRFGAELTNVNTIALCTAVSAIIGVYNLIFSRTSKWKTLLSAITVAFCFIISMAGASKKSLLVIIVCFFGMSFYNALGSRRIGKQIRNFILTIAAIFGVVYMIMTLPVFSGIASRYEYLFDFLSGGSGTSSEVKRFEFIEQGLQVFMQNFLLGAGTASSTYYLGVYSHNNFVEILMNSGLVGFVGFHFPYFIAGYRYLKRPMRYKNNSKIYVLLVALLLGITICSIALVYYYDRYYMILLTVVFSATEIVGKESGSEQERLSNSILVQK